MGGQTYTTSPVDKVRLEPDLIRLWGSEEWNSYMDKGDPVLRYFNYLDFIDKAIHQH